MSSTTISSSDTTSRRRFDATLRPVNQYAKNPTPSPSRPRASPRPGYPTAPTASSSAFMRSILAADHSRRVAALDPLDPAAGERDAPRPGRVGDRRSVTGSAADTPWPVTYKSEEQSFPLWIREDLACNDSSDRIEHMFEGDLTALSTADLL